jgi:hypothetical protein
VAGVKGGTDFKSCLDLAGGPRVSLRVCSAGVVCIWEAYAVACKSCKLLSHEQALSPVGGTGEHNPPQRPCGLLAGGVGGMELVMGCLPSFFDLWGHPRLCTQRCTAAETLLPCVATHSLTHPVSTALPEPLEADPQPLCGRSVQLHTCMHQLLFLSVSGFECLEPPHRRGSYLLHASALQNGTAV